MKKIMLKLVVVGMLFFSAGVAIAIPAPCEDEKLLSSSTYAIEGWVIGSHCGFPHGSTECTPPNLVTNCIATVRVTKNLKGKYQAGNIVNIPFEQNAWTMPGASCIIPGRPKRHFTRGEKIAYYDSDLCEFYKKQHITSMDEQVSDVSWEDVLKYAMPISMIIIVLLIFKIISRQRRKHQK